MITGTKVSQIRYEHVLRKSRCWMRVRQINEKFQFNESTKVKGPMGLQFTGKSEGTRGNSLKRTESRHSWLRDRLHRMGHMNLVTVRPEMEVEIELKVN